MIDRVGRTTPRCRPRAARCATVDSASRRRDDRRSEVLGGLVARWVGTASMGGSLLLPRVLCAADAAAKSAKVANPVVGAALAALLAICILGAVLLAFVWLTGRQVRRLARKPVSKTNYDPLWFLKPLRPRKRNPDEATPPRGEDPR